MSPLQSKLSEREERLRSITANIRKREEARKEPGEGGRLTGGWVREGPGEGGAGSLGGRVRGAGEGGPGEGGRLTGGRVRGADSLGAG